MVKCTQYSFTLSNQTTCSSDSNLKNELLPVCVGVIRGLRVLRHMHVEPGHTFLQVFIQLGNLDGELQLRRSEP